MIKVYHQVEPTFRASKTGIVNEDLHLVAEVATDNLDEAYYLTSTIEKGWWQNDGVKFLGSREHGMKGARSTSVGDVMQMDNNFYQVDSVGFNTVQVVTCSQCDGPASHKSGCPQGDYRLIGGEWHKVVP